MQAEATMLSNGYPCLADAIFRCMGVRKESDKGHPYGTIRFKGPEQLSGTFNINIGNPIPLVMFLLQLSCDFVSNKFTYVVFKLLFVVGKKRSSNVRKFVPNNTV